MQTFLYSPHGTPQHPDRWLGPSGAGGRTGGRIHELPLCSLRYSAGGWERVLASVRVSVTVDPRWDRPAVSIRSLTTYHLLLASSCWETKALIHLFPCTKILTQISLCVFSLLHLLLNEETCWLSLQESVVLTLTKNNIKTISEKRLGAGHHTHVQTPNFIHSEFNPNLTKERDGWMLTMTGSGL